MQTTTYTQRSKRICEISTLLYSTPKSIRDFAFVMIRAQSTENSFRRMIVFDIPHRKLLLIDIGYKAGFTIATALLGTYPIFT